jgi:putative DNA primase/helicase
MHRTYLDADGNKLNIKDVRKILPFIGKKDDDDRPTGGACWLFPLDEKMELGIAEGIETAIAATELFGIPTWAATTAIFLEKFYPPKNIKKIVIYGDNDNNYTGQKAAYALANTMSVVRKIEVEVRIPETTGHDWLDYLQGKNHV